MVLTLKKMGFREMDAALGELSKASARSVGKKVLKLGAKPLVEQMKALAPDDPVTGTGDLKSTIAASDKLSPRQKKLQRRAVKGGGKKSFAEIYVGPGPLPQAHQQEFGNVNHGPQPFARPAWRATRRQVLDRVGESLGREIAAAAMRAKRRALKKAKR